MAVAWIGNRAVTLEEAGQEAVRLLNASKCPVITLNTDLHGARVAVALAERIGAAIDLADAGTMREALLIADKGAMSIAPGETRRRADVLIIVGALPASYDQFVAELADSKADLSGADHRQLFVIAGKAAAFGKRNQSAVALSTKGGPAATLAAVRAQLGGRQVQATVSNFGKFAEALNAARFPVFLYSSFGCDPLAMEMLQGLVADINRKSRASTLHFPASEAGWGAALAATWMTGFPGRLTFARGRPEFDAWRFDVRRMLVEGEADLHLQVGGKAGPDPTEGVATRIVFAQTARPPTGAAVTITTQPAGAVVYSARLGTFEAVGSEAEGNSGATAASVLRLIGERCKPEGPLPC